MNAIEMLEQDHQGAKKVMEDILISSGTKKKQLFTALMHELEVHDSIEEEIFYPAVLSNPKTASFPAQDVEAHRSVEAALARLAKLSVEDPAWTPSFSAMRSALLKHVDDEEKVFFVKIREVLSAAELDALGVKMKSAKEKHLKAA
jgi:hemerythrin superfamily protein